MALTLSAIRGDGVDALVQPARLVQPCIVSNEKYQGQDSWLLGRDAVPREEMEAQAGDATTYLPPDELAVA